MKNTTSDPKVIEMLYMCLCPTCGNEINPETDATRWTCYNCNLIFINTPEGIEIRLMSD